MKFFIPDAKDNEQEAAVYNSIKSFISEKSARTVFDDKIYTINFRHNGKEYSATVGETNNCNNEMVVAIFETPDLYLLCTPNRGVKGGEPILVNKKSASIILFD